MTIEKLRKRDGREVEFDKEKIADALALPLEPLLGRLSHGSISRKNMSVSLRKKSIP